MKGFILRVVIFVIIVIVCDIAVGYLGNYLVQNAKGGDTQRENYIAYNTYEDVLIFGSSRAVHHYDPDVLEDTLGATIYNCGFAGNGVICAYGLIKMLQERYCPQVLIYEVTPGYDLLEGDNNTYLGQLRYFYGNPCVDSIFRIVDEKERYKMSSHMYQFNSVLPMLITDNIYAYHSFRKGYSPMDGDMIFEPREIKTAKTPVYDSIKIYYIEKLVESCNGKTQLIFTISPSYKNSNDSILEPIKRMCRQYGIPLINHYTDSVFNRRKEWFYDASHLNRIGATEYSKVIASEIKQLLERQHSSTSPSGT